MEATVLHFPHPEPPRPPEPVPYPTAPPVPERGAPLPLPIVYEMPVWTYKHVSLALGDVARFCDAELEALGAEGWELTGVLTEGATAHLFFKRPGR